MKMKKITVCRTCRRSLLVARSGRISSMAAPVVPIRLAGTPPTARNAVFVPGCAGRSPRSRIPPRMTYNASSSTINGTYSSSTAFASTCPSTGQPASSPVAHHGPVFTVIAGCTIP
jgi:hypothetical protein